MSKTFGIIALIMVLGGALTGGILGARGAMPGYRAALSTSSNPDVDETPLPFPSQNAVGADRLTDDFNQALAVVSNSYVDDVDYEHTNQTAIQGMLWTLDPHSNYFPQAEYRKLLEEQDARFYGIGVNILRHRDGVYVQSPVEGTPAARAGLRHGDRIVEIDGKDAREWTSQQVSKQVRGERGTPVRLRVERAGNNAPIFFEIVRAEVPLPSVRNAFMLRPDTGYIGLTGSFTHTSGEEVAIAIDALKRSGAKQFVLDLRNNPGGLLDQAISVAGQFLPRNATVLTVKARGQTGAREYRNTETTMENAPLVVLINHNSASASEIVAGAVQDYARGLIVGETSFGKGLVQRVFPLPLGAGLTLTTARYYTPYGRSLQRDYSAGSLYDYYTQRDEASETNHASTSSPNAQTTPSASPTPTPAPTPPPNSPAIKTAGGRTYYGGGGITPDIEARPLDLSTATRAKIFDAAFYFSIQLTNGLVPGLESFRVGAPRYNQTARAGEYQINERVLEAFREFIKNDPAHGVTVAQLDADLDFASLRLRNEVIIAAYGGDAGERTLLETDPQLLKGIDALPEAKRIAEAVKNGTTLG